MIADAIDTAITLGWALAAWVIVLSVVASILTLAAIATGAWGVRALWRHTAGPSWARGDLRARIYAARRVRRHSGRVRPLWSHSQPLDYEEAA